jgi:DNA-binding LacI/PurR family transcriptional regulator
LLNKRVTIKQIAKELNVSMMTVSRALNDRSNVDSRTKQRVLETAARLGYKPNYVAKSLAMNKTFSIGVVFPEISHSFFPEVIKGIEEVASKNEYQLILSYTAENQSREIQALQTLESKRVDGILISMAQDVDNTEHYKVLIDDGFPLTFFDRCATGLGASCVRIDDYQSAMLVMKHLMGLGYEKIAHLHGPVKLELGRQRLEGYKDALKNGNLSIREELMVESGFSEKGGYEAMNNILALRKTDLPEAVMCVNDPVAIGAMEAIALAGLKVPDDIAITGFTDDVRAKLIRVPLTTIEQPTYTIGKKAARKLLKHIASSEEGVEDIVLDTRLIIRESCGARKKSEKLSVL